MWDGIYQFIDSLSADSVDEVDGKLQGEDDDQ